MKINKKEKKKVFPEDGSEIRHEDFFHVSSIKHDLFHFRYGTFLLCSFCVILEFLVKQFINKFLFCLRFFFFLSPPHDFDLVPKKKGK